MTNLLKEYGMEEFGQRIMGCSIMYDGHPTQTSHVGTHPETGAKMIFAEQYIGTPERFAKREIMIAPDYFTGMMSLRYPQLGYRTAAAGQYLAYYSRIPTAVRKGLHLTQLKVEMSKLSRALEHYTGFDMEYYTNPSIQTMLIHKPVIMGWQEGLQKVKEGEIISFVVDENFAVVPSSHNKHYMMILYRDRMIGTLSEGGNIEIASVNAKAAWRQVTEGRVSQ